MSISERRTRERKRAYRDPLFLSDVAEVLKPFEDERCTECGLLMCTGLLICDKHGVGMRKFGQDTGLLVELISTIAEKHPR